MIQARMYFVMGNRLPFFLTGMVVHPLHTKIHATVIQITHHHVGPKGKTDYLPIHITARKNVIMYK